VSGTFLTRSRVHPPSTPPCRPTTPRAAQDAVDQRDADVCLNGQDPGQLAPFYRAVNAPQFFWTTAANGPGVINTLSQMWATVDTVSKSATLNGFKKKNENDPFVPWDRSQALPRCSSLIPCDHCRCHSQRWLPRFRIGSVYTGLV
jgi:hypothetical protein